MNNETVVLDTNQIRGLVGLAVTGVVAITAGLGYVFARTLPVVVDFVYDKYTGYEGRKAGKAARIEELKSEKENA